MKNIYEIHAYIGDDYHDTHHQVKGTYRECMRELHSRVYPGQKLRIIYKERM